MPDDLTKPLAKVIYDAHARSRGLKTKFQDLGNEEKHWLNVSAAVLEWFGDYLANQDDEEALG